MPAIIELRLRPATPMPRGFEPTTRQLHGLACTLFEGTGADHADQEKAWTVWPVRSGHDGSWLFRGAWLRAGFPQNVLASCGTVQLGPAECAVTDIAFRPMTHDELADVPPVDGARLTFLSPAYFSQSGQHIAEPDVRLIAGFLAAPLERVTARWIRAGDRCPAMARHPSGAAHHRLRAAAGHP